MTIDCRKTAPSYKIKNLINMSHCSRPRMTDEAEVEHELVSFVFVVLDYDGVTGNLLGQNVDRHCSPR